MEISLVQFLVLMRSLDFGESDVSGFSCINIHIPASRSPEPTLCGFCNGSGDDVFNIAQPCTCCSGSGEVWKIDHKQAYATANSLELLLEVLKFNFLELQQEKNQTFTFEVSIGKGSGRQTIEGNLFNEFSSWLRKASLDDLASLERTLKQRMMETYC